MLRLGLDLGTNSIGWALFRLSDGEPHEPIELVDGGVLIHADGRNPKDRASNAAKRREKRGPRRNRDRAILRQRRVANQLHDLGLLPDDEDARIATRNLDPVCLRSQALALPLTRYELGRVLLSFATRRGFQSNRKAGSTSEDGKIRKDTQELRRRMGQTGDQTLGKYLWRRRSREKKDKTIRARLGNGLYPDRRMVKDELEQIRNAQAQHHPYIKDKHWDTIISTLLHQRDLRPVERGRCTLIPAEYRAYRAYPLFQEFRIWQEVLNVQVASPGERLQPLATEDRDRVVAKLKHTKVQDFEKLFPDAARINLSTTARSKLDGDLTAAVLRPPKLFGKGWDGLEIERQQDIVERLLDEKDHEKLVDWLRNDCRLGEESAEAIASASLPPGTAHLSKAAIERLLPHMRKGLPYDKAVEAAGLGSHSDLRGAGRAERLPYYGSVLERHVIGRRTDGQGRSNVERFGRIANPTVHIALGQVRRLFNAIVDKHGKPHQVVVELARELKQSADERDRDQKNNRENQERNERLRELAANAGFSNPSGHYMRKLRLWDEQGKPDARVCPFTGETLSIGRVLSAETEIEHILPFSRSLDDSMANTVLSMRGANREKGQRTPYEAWGHDPIRYQEIMRRVGALPRNKQWRFEEDAMERLQERDDFLGRQLNDTRYLSRMTRRYLQEAVLPDNVWVTPGRLTAMLRHAWGLNTLLSDDGRKSRDDHRHHLVDAVVVGMTSRSLLKRVATDSARAVDDLGERIAKTVQPPWSGFREDVLAVVRRTTVRHRPDHFLLKDKWKQRREGRDVTTGTLHNDTAYGIVDGPDSKGRMTLVETKPLGALLPGRLNDIRDLTLRQKLLELWERCESVAGTAADKRNDFLRAARRLRGVRRVRVLTRIRKGNLALIPYGSDRPYKAYKTNGNAFMDVWLLPNEKVVGETVSRFHAHQPTFQSAVKREHPTAKKLMRLHVNDMIAIGKGNEPRILCVRVLSGAKITVVDHNEGGDLRRRERDPAHPHPYLPLVLAPSAVHTKGMRKVSVDVLGHLRDRGPFSKSASRD